MHRRLALTACLLLAACGSSEEKAAEKTADKIQSVPEVAETASAVTLRPGEWEITTEVMEMSIPGMPAGAIPQQAMQKNSLKSCLKSEQTRKPDASFFSGRRDSNCTYEGFEMTAGRVSGTISCPTGEGTQKMTIAGRYEPERYDTTMDMASERMNLKVRTTGKRLGDCPAS